MKKPSDEQQREQLRQRIIGLGERSLKKSYYPELQKQIRELEKTNTELEKEIAERKKSEQIKKKLESQLMQAQKMEAIGTLAGGIAHDFNNILSAIIGYTELASIHLDKCTKLTECPVLKDLDGVLRSADRAKQLVQQILSFSSRQSGEHAPISLENIVLETSKMLRALIPTTIAIEHDIRTQDSTISADATQINQVIMNLGTNGYHAMREHGGILKFELVEKTIEKNDVLFSDLQLRPGSYIILQVSDTGCGMSKKIQNKIFDPYFSTKQSEGGSGLGLSVVHGIVTQHGGHISVYSEKDKGTTFRVYFPKLQEAIGADITEGQIMELIAGNERILVVDDEPDLLTIIQGTLSTLGYNVTTTNSSCEALDFFGKDPESFDLLVTDMNMPEMSGAELISHIRQIQPEFPVILCTGFSEIMNAENTTALGNARYIMKPATQRQLNTAIRSLLDNTPENS